MIRKDLRRLSNDSEEVRRNAQLGLILLALLTACTRASGSWGVPGEVRIGYLGTIYTLDPLIAFGQRLIDLTQLYTQPLVGVGTDSRAIPVLCTQIPSVKNGGISRDGLTITYHLRHVRFADGVPFTSRDVAFTYRAILDPRNPVTEAAPYRRIAALETPDPYTVRIRLRAPWSGAVYELFAASDYIFGILPAHAFHNDTDLSHAVAWNDRPFGTGPFVVTEWNRGDSVVFEPNQFAWQKPKLQRIIVKMIADENTAYIALLTHAIDFTDITFDQAEQAKHEPGIALVPIPRNNVDSVEIQTEHVPDVQIRRAIAYAIDREAIARDIYHGESALATTEIPTLFPQHDASIKPLPYDPARARALLAGRHLTLHISFNLSENTYKSVATLVQADLRAVGFDAQLKGATPSLLYAPPEQGGVLYDGRFDLEIGGWYGGLDPEASAYLTCANRAPHGPNVARWCDAQYDAAFYAQQRILDPVARTKQFWIMQRRVAAELPIIVLVERTEFEAVNPALRGFAPNMLYNFGQTQDWSLL
jgi:peptide/nickel transport system substrate-binding protein